MGLGSLYPHLIFSFVIFPHGNGSGLSLLPSLSAVVNETEDPASGAQELVPR